MPTNPTVTLMPTDSTDFTTDQKLDIIIEALQQIAEVIEQFEEKLQDRGLTPTDFQVIDGIYPDN